VVGFVLLRASWFVLPLAYFSTPGAIGLVAVPLLLTAVYSLSARGYTVFGERWFEK
jgi:hypothetical protein